ncbi:MAG: ThiF family adenylyltransferase [Bacteroidetes bacterium]|nr:ThiF family adenylyltransferase [Bacteroidota bacterium]
MDEIVNGIQSFEGVQITQAFNLVDSVAKGEITLTVDNATLHFRAEVHPHYPFQYHDTETIRFINKELLPYNHVNVDGSICVHTLHSADLKTKLASDLNSLKEWVKKYYLANTADNHYEHIMVVPSGSGENQALWFTEVDHVFTPGEFGQFHYSLLATGFVKKQPTNTFLIQEFKTRNGLKPCSWNSYYKKSDKNVGIFLFLDAPPVTERRFVVKNWQELEPYLSQEFLKCLYDFRASALGAKAKYQEFKLILGYPISDTEIHWQSINILKDDFPTYPEKVGPGKYEGRCYDKPIDWMATKNCSPKYFFGRGALSPKITKGKILIIGVGAIGSILGTALVRGGATDIFLNDHDVKEPENVCRSEYQFNSGTVSKIYELQEKLMQISPFVEVNVSEEITDIIKRFRGHEQWQSALEDAFNRFDFIFDCTTDNDLAYIFSQLSLNAEVINLSITNHAKELVCVFKEDQYRWLMSIFNSLNNDVIDLYNPTGCWSPTFKAGYNDIAVLVHFALKQINNAIVNDKPLRNFYLATDYSNNFEIKLKEF